MTWTLQRRVAPGLYDIWLSVAPSLRVRREHVNILVHGVAPRKVIVTRSRFHMHTLVRPAARKLSARVVGCNGLPRVSASVVLLKVNAPSDSGAPSATMSASAPIQLGAYVPGAPGNAHVLDDYATTVGRKPNIVNLYRDLTLPLLYPNEIANLRARGEIPMVSWDPDQNGHVIPLADIAAGKYDGYIRQAADLAKGLGMTVMIRFAYEMNLRSSPWAGSGATYISAWRHVVAVVRQQGASNVKWVWSPNVDDGRSSFTSFFPGDAWIDYAALDGYNYGSRPNESWQSLAQVFQSSYNILTQISTKPVIIAETSSNNAGGNKAAWIRTGFLSSIPQRMPRVRAVVWFDADKPRQADWTIDSSPASLAAYRSVVASSLYGVASRNAGTAR